LPRIETRRACDRCKRFKARCSGGFPCGRCQKAGLECVLTPVQRPSISAETENQSPTTSTISAEQLQERNNSVTSTLVGPPDQPFTPFDQKTNSADTFPTPSTPGQSVPLDSLDWNFFYSTLQDINEPEAPNAPNSTEPDFGFDPWVAGFPGMVEGFSPVSIIDDTKLDWNFDGFSLNRLDPFEYHRLQIIEYLRNSCTTTPSQLACFSPANAKVFFHAYFRRFHPHSPFQHLPTFDISKISTSLYFAMLVLGALHCGEVGTDDVTRALWHPAESYVWSQATVYRFRSLIQDIEPGSPEALETIQALFLLSVFHIFCMREPGQHPSYDFAKLMNTAKTWKIFHSDRQGEASQDWHTWVTAEQKKRCTRPPN
jgi:hypothetical protein